MARRRGAAGFFGSYRPSPKNGMVREHYKRLGFQLVDESADGETRWQLGLDSPIDGNASITTKEQTNG